MLQTCLWITTGGGQGIFYINIYTYCMYTIKLKALILSIVFNYQRFLMKIDCTKCFVFLLLFFCLCMLLPEQMNFMDGTQSTHSSCSSSSGVKKKKTKKIKGIVAVIVCCPSWMHKLNICNSDFVSGFSYFLTHHLWKFEVISTYTESLVLSKRWPGLKRTFIFI